MGKGKNKPGENAGRGCQPGFGPKVDRLTFGETAEGGVCVWKGGGGGGALSTE